MELVILLFVGGFFTVFVALIAGVASARARIRDLEQDRDAQAAALGRHIKRVNERLQGLEDAIESLQAWLAENLPTPADPSATPVAEPAPATDAAAQVSRTAARTQPTSAMAAPTGTPADESAPATTPVATPAPEHCPMCDLALEPGSNRCICGYISVAAAITSPSTPRAAEPTTAPEPTTTTPDVTGTGTFACPRCDAEVARDATECARCGNPLIETPDITGATVGEPPVRVPRRRKRAEEAPAPPPPPPEPGWIEQLQAQFAGEEWETIIGGSLLNKIGALILVIGVALFLNYSYDKIGPGGRVALGYALGGVLLLAGFMAEKRSKFLIFARGLVGAGWAAIYYTTYAMHAVPSSRLIESPATAMVLLFTVAGGMIAHAVTTGSEAITALAYFIGFVTLLISPRTDFSLVASIPLIASMLFVAYRYKWDRIMVGGVAFTYGSYVLCLGEVAWRTPLTDPIINSKMVLATYWLMFEIYDLICVAKRPDQGTLARSLFPMNAIGFVGTVLMHKPSGDPLALPHFLATTAAAYLVSSFIRAWLRAPATFTDKDEPMERAIRGGYEGAISVCVLLLVPSLLLWFGGARVVLALLVSAEMLFLAGVRLEQPYLRALGVFVFEIAALRAFYDWSDRTTREAFGLTVWRFTPGALLVALVGYGNRAFFRREQGSSQDWQFGCMYSITASALLFAVIGCELPKPYIGTGWLVQALILLEIGARANRKEFRGQAYVVGISALGALGITGVLRDSGPSPYEPYLGLGLSAVLCGLWSLRYYRLPPAGLDEFELGSVRDTTSAAATACLLAFLWRVLPMPVVAIGWGVVALALHELGSVAHDRFLRFQGHIAAALAFIRLPIANFALEGQSFGLSHRVLTVVPMAAMFIYAWTRLLDDAREGIIEEGERWMTRIYLYPAPILVAALVRFEMGVMTVAVGWSILLAVIIGLGRRFRIPDLRWQGYALTAATFLRCWSTNFAAPETMPMVSDAYGRIATGVFVIAALFVAQFMLPRPQDEAAAYADDPGLGQVDHLARPVWCVLATVLLTLLIFYEVSGGMLTVAWGVEGVVLMITGFPLRDRTLRYAGIFLLLGCIVKLMLLDLRHMEVPFRIISFCLLGALLIGVSWFYSRYREELKKYL